MPKIFLELKLTILIFLHLYFLLYISLKMFIAVLLLHSIARTILFFLNFSRRFKIMVSEISKFEFPRTASSPFCFFIFSFLGRFSEPIFPSSEFVIQGGFPIIRIFLLISVSNLKSNMLALYICASGMFFFTALQYSSFISIPILGIFS